METDKAKKAAHRAMDKCLDAIRKMVDASIAFDVAAKAGVETTSYVQAGIDARDRFDEANRRMSMSLATYRAAYFNARKQEKP